MAKITVLMDNHAVGTLSCEWGLSFLIEDRGRKILLDMGQSGAFAQNADALGIDLADVDAAVLSHAHYDHADGMEAFFARNTKARLYVREGTQENCYGKNDEGADHYIGIRHGLLETYAERIQYAGLFEEIAEGIWLVGHSTPNLAEVGRRVGMKLRVGDGWKADDFAHEQSLVLRGRNGLIILNSCSHAGPDVIIGEVRERFPGEQIMAYLGGLHLFRSSDQEVENLAEQLLTLGVEKIVTGHCTGDQAFAILKDRLGDTVEQLYAGYTVEF